MPYFEIHLIQRGSDTPFLRSPRSTTFPGSYAVGDTITVGTGPGLVIGAVMHRWLPGPNGPNDEPLFQTGLVVSAHAGNLVESMTAAPWLEPGGDFVPWPMVQEAAEGVGRVFEGVGTTLEEAVGIAHAQVPTRPHRDFTVSKVVGWGMQRGGLTDETLFYAQVVEDPDAPFRTGRVAGELAPSGQV